MQFVDYARIVRKRWLIVLALTVLGTLVAVVPALNAPKTYTAGARFFVGTTVPADSAEALEHSNNFLQQRVKSYASLVGSQAVLGPVAAGLGEDPSGGTLVGQVTATTPVESVMVDVVVTDPSPTRALAIASGIVTEFPRAVTSLERVGDSSPVKVTVVQAPSEAKAMAGPRVFASIVVGVVLGLLVGVGVALLLDQWRGGAARRPATS